jgi:hypothetical protein
MSTIRFRGVKTAEEKQTAKTSISIQDQEEEEGITIRQVRKGVYLYEYPIIPRQKISERLINLLPSGAAIKQIIEAYPFVIRFMKDLEWNEAISKSIIKYSIVSWINSVLPAIQTWSGAKLLGIIKYAGHHIEIIDMTLMVTKIDRDALERKSTDQRGIVLFVILVLAVATAQKYITNVR